MEDAIEPLVKIDVQIKCTNPDCGALFKVEGLEKDGETLTKCPKCSRWHYVRTTSSQIYVKSLGGMK